MLSQRPEPLLSETAPAKINLCLHVTGQRADGYHLIESLVAFADFGDKLTLTPAEADALIVTGPFAEAVPGLDENLVGRALALVRGYSLEPLPPLAIHLEKNLPVAAGIGGGSADAAALVRALWPEPIPQAFQKQLTALGADIPMCLQGKAALASGIGDEVEPVDVPELAIVLVNPGVEVSTPAIFKTLKSKDNAPLAKLPEPLDRESLMKWLGAARNDLTQPAIALCPEIADCLKALRQRDPLIAGMSGSGATCFALCHDDESAAALADAISADHPDWWVRAGRLNTG